MLFKKVIKFTDNTDKQKQMDIMIKKMRTLENIVQHIRPILTTKDDMLRMFVDAEMPEAKLALEYFDTLEIQGELPNGF